MVFSAPGVNYHETITNLSIDPPCPVGGFPQWWPCNLLPPSSIGASVAVLWQSPVSTVSPLQPPVWADHCRPPRTVSRSELPVSLRSASLLLGTNKSIKCKLGINLEVALGFPSRQVKWRAAKEYFYPVSPISWQPSLQSHWKGLTSWSLCTPGWP